MKVLCVTYCKHTRLTENKDVMAKILTLLLLLLPPASQAVQLTGVISDQNGDPIPYASVIVENTTHGVITNLKGQYYLELSPGKHSIIYRHPEFETVKAVVTMQTQTVYHNVKMKPATTNLNAFIVTADGEDPAYGIIRSAIKKRKYYLNQFESYTCSTYIKCAIERGNPDINWSSGEQIYSKEHQNFIESFSTTHYQKPGQFKQIVHAYNDHVVQHEVISVSIDMGPEQIGPPQKAIANPNLFRSSTSSDEFNFYRNLIDMPALGTTPFISPISATAMLSYDYKLEETFPQDSVYIHKVKVIPKRKASATFSGYIYIEDASWAIRAVDLNITPHALMLHNTFYITQEYDKAAQSFYVLKREEYFYTRKEGKEQVFGNTILMHSDYEINKEFPPRFFKNEIRQMTDEAYDQDTSFWNQNRPITLRAEEEAFIHYQDSIIAYQASDAYKNERDSTYNQVEFLDFLIMGVGSGTGQKNNLFTLIL